MKRRTRHEQKIDRVNHYQGMEQEKSPNRATEAFKRKPYEVHDVPSYIMAKYGMKKK